MSARRWLAAAGALALTGTLAACANLPTSGTIQISTLHGAGVVGQGGVQMVPGPPGKGWSPEDIVKGFMAASADYDPHHQVAKEYLTTGKRGFERRWQPGWAATIIDAPDISQTPPIRGISEQGGGPQPADVEVSGLHVAALRTSGRYQAGSVVVMPTTTKYRFELVQVAGQWRINNIFVNNAPANPTLLLLRKSDFEREYQARNLYFYPATGATDTLVPDPVYIPAQVGNRGVRGLVQTLLQPALDRGWLFAAAKTAFPPGTKLLSAQVVSGVTAVVDLGGAAANADRAQRQRMAAQLYSSLVLAPYPAETANPIRSVVLKLDGRPVQMLPQDYAGWVPRGPAKALLYYQMPTSPVGPAVAALRAKASQTGSLPLPKALEGQTFTAMAVSTAPVGSAVLAGCSGKHVYLMPQSHAGQVITGHMNSACTSLSFDDRGELWIVTKMQIYVIPQAGTDPPAHLALTGVLSPSLDKASIQSLQVAPDGVRAALLIKAGSSTRIRIAAITHNKGQYTYVAQNTQMLRIGTDVAKPVALTWLDPDNLLVLGQVGTRTQLYEVPLNGGQSTPIATPHGVTSVAASWPAGQNAPTIAVAIAPAGNSPGVIQVAKSGLLNPNWRQVAKGITPVFPGCGALAWRGFITSR
ncbi:MAG TPA: LpqB family beta-propeller domain-containing protein [Streptosporangiaceae bacterium]